MYSMLVYIAITTRTTFESSAIIFTLAISTKGRTITSFYIYHKKHLDHFRSNQ